MKIEKLLFEKAGLQPRKLPVSDILVKRQEQVVKLIQSWDSGIETEILAENFFQDKSRKHRMKEIQNVLDKAGEIRIIGDIDPENQLRGSFNIQARNGVINVSFTLSPENDPKIQALYVSFKPN